MNTKGTLNSFSPDNQYFAFYHLSGQLRVFDTDNGQCFLNLKTHAKLERTNSLLKGKKKVLCWLPSSSQSEDLEPVLFVGGAYGVEAVHVRKGQVLWRTQIEHGVSSLAFFDGTLYFSTIQDRCGGQINVEEGKVIVKFKIGKHKARHILPVKGRDRLLVGGSRLVLWDATIEKPVVKFSGHTTEICSMCASACQKFAITGGEDDRQIALWNLQSSERNAICLLTMDHPPLSISANSIQDSLVICALSQDGVVYVWKCGNLHKKTLESTLWAKIELDHTTKKEEEEGILYSQVEVRMEEVVVHLVRDSTLVPHFETYTLPEIASTPQAITLSRKPVSLLTQTDNKPGAESQKKRKREVTLVGADNQGEAAQIAHLSGRSKTKLPLLPHPTTINQPEVELTLGERLSHLEKKFQSPEKEETVKKSFLSASSAAVLVQQVNQSGDIELFTRLSQLPRDLMLPTVRHLSDLDASKFLQFCIERIHLRPKDALSVVWWIRALLKIHAPYLMSSPTIQQQLKFLHQLIDTRLSVFDNLVSMSGRIDLLLSQIEYHKKVTEQKDSEMVIEVNMSDDESIYEEVEYHEEED